MSDTKYLRTLQYEPTEWEDRVKDQNGNVLVEGTPVNEVNLNNIEAGILVAHYDIGLLAAFLAQQTRMNATEIEKYKKQRLLQGQATITYSGDAPYFRSADPYVLVSFPADSYPQLNAPNYDVHVSIIDASDIGAVGELIVYDKTQNGFKIRMTGSAKTVTVMWTVINLKVQ